MGGRDRVLIHRTPRAYAAYIAGILINVVGFAGATGRAVPLAATRIYEMSFFTGFGVSALIYWSLNILFPVRGWSECTVFEEVDISWNRHRTEDSEDMGSDRKNIANASVYIERAHND